MFDCHGCKCSNEVADSNFREEDKLSCFVNSSRLECIC